MQPIKVIEYSNKLAVSDMKRISALLKSSPKNKPVVIALFDEILQNKISGEKNSKNILWKALYKKKPLNEKHFRKLCFELLQKIEDALTLIHTEQNTNENNLNLLKYYSSYNTANLFTDKWKQLKVKKSTSHLLSSTFFLEAYTMELIRYEYLVSNSSKADTNNIVNTSASLDAYYFLKKLKLICHALNEEKFTKYSELPAYSEFVIQTLSAPGFKSNSLIEIYLSIYKLLSGEGITEFITLKKNIEEFINIDVNEWRIIYQYVINYCIIQLNKGKQEYEQELFEIYKSYLQKIPDKIFSPFRYKNIINLSLKLKQFEFAASFIDEYGQRLPEDQRQTSIAFNKAKLNYELKNFDSVISTLQSVKNDDLTFNLSSKVLLTKTFYEKKEFQFLESFLESFRIYILRNKNMNTESKKLYQTFIKHIQRLVSLEYKSAKDINLFREKINKQENLTDKAWLLEKIANV
ncbi:MAG: hypothetical protein JWN78_1658 [Bacteroidota bacterium]|nr:hypothetical protein [Bacteroidota bacterium]